MDILAKIAHALPEGTNLREIEALIDRKLMAIKPELAAAQALCAWGKLDTADYLEKYPDVALSRQDPILHFVQYGVNEERKIAVIGVAEEQKTNVLFKTAKIEAQNSTRQSESIKKIANASSKSSAILLTENLSKATTASWSAIITLWKRKEYLKEQIEAIYNQSIVPNEVIIIINENHISESSVRAIVGSNVKIVCSDINSLYTRFTLAYIAEGEYISVFDDDIIPGKYWIANAIRACRSYNALIGPQGRIYNTTGKKNFFKIISPDIEDKTDTISCADTDIYCDWVCNSYLFKREWIGAILGQLRYKDSYKTFDDIQLATSLFINKGIRCVTPMQPPFAKELHGSLKMAYGSDDFAVWKTNSEAHFAERKQYLEILLRQGYIPVQQRDNLYRFHLIVPFGERSLLERCLLSIKGQIYDNFTCTIIDDCIDGANSLELLAKLNMDKRGFRYIRCRKRVFPLRSREIATDILQASPADVIVHLDGDDWFAIPDVLKRLNRIYRRGDVLATYGNAVALKNHKHRDFSEYSPIEMSKKWNMAQKDPNAKIINYRRIEEREISKGWEYAPWCAMHTRTFQYAKWPALNRKTFFDKAGNYLKCATDAAVIVPIFNTMSYSSIFFVPDISYTYQRAGNNTFTHDKAHLNNVKEAREVVRDASNTPDRDSIINVLIDVPKFPEIREANILYDGIANLSKLQVAEQNEMASMKLFSEEKNCIVTIATPDRICDALICVMSYKRNLQIKCQPYIFVANNDSILMQRYSKLFHDIGIELIYPSTLQYTEELASELLVKYAMGTDEYRWGMKSVIIIELLRRGHCLVLYLDSDIYTVSDITDLHQLLVLHSISVFPHFRDCDNTRLRITLYKDGFFNGGMLAATKSGMPDMLRLHKRCANIIAKDTTRQLYDDQKYFDLFMLEGNDIYVNQDRGIDYGSWNEEPIENLVSPSQRSILLKSGFYIRIWHMATNMIKYSFKPEKSRYTIYRPVVTIYLVSILYTIIFFISRLNLQINNKLLDDYHGLINRYNTIKENLLNILPKNSLDQIDKLMFMSLKCNLSNYKEFIKQWTTSILNSICFDNYEIFALLMEDFCPKDQFFSTLIEDIRRHDLRYVSEQILCNPQLTFAEMEKHQEIINAGTLLKSQIQSLQNHKLIY